MKEGTVKWYNEKKGYGFIESDTDGEVFMHSSGITDHGFFTLQKSDRVTYETKETNRGCQAVNVRKMK
ncbi:MAG: cold shock domain-containing protein [Desulfobacterales bacterium]|nr:cold shock domain-containing protein [Desulfobacterales bacterium]